MAALLPDLELPGKMRAEKQAFVQHNIKLSGEAMKADFDRLHSRLEAIEASNQQMADQKVITALNDTKYIVQDGKHTEIVKH